MYGLNAMSRSAVEDGGATVIGDVETTRDYVVLRIGETIGERHGSGWQQTGRVVLDETEAVRLAEELRSRLAGRGLVVVNMEDEGREILGSFERRDEDMILYRSNATGELTGACDDCVAVMSVYDAEQAAGGG